MIIGVNGVLGIAMGSSEAAGSVTSEGNIPNWLKELAFAPIDYNPVAPVEEWSGDHGCVANYLSKQALFRLCNRVGIAISDRLSSAQKLEFVQAMHEKDMQARGLSGVPCLLIRVMLSPITLIFRIWNWY